MTGPTTILLGLIERTTTSGRNLGQRGSPKAITHLKRSSPTIVNVERGNSRKKINKPSSHALAPRSARLLKLCMGFAVISSKAKGNELVSLFTEYLA